MKQKYQTKKCARTVIISAGGNCTDIRKVVEPVLQRDGGSIYYINLSQDEYKRFFVCTNMNTIGKTHQQLKMPPSLKERSIPFRN
jgi:phosphoribosylformylglycinamidine synthase